MTMAQQVNEASREAPTERLLSFIEFLRGRDITISPADSLVAMEVAGLVGYSDRTLLKNGLASALAKSKFEIEIFNEAFEQYFASKQNANNQDDSGQSQEDQASPEQLAQQLEQALEAQPELANKLSSDLVEALKSGDQAAIAIAVETAAQQVDVAAIKLLTPVSYTHLRAHET